MRSENGYQYKIFEISDTNSALELISFGDFGPSIVAELRFPQVIKSMKNGRFIFHPQSFSLSLSEQNFPNTDISKIDVEEWQQNEDWTRSFLNFPVDFTDMGEIWIFQI